MVTDLVSSRDLPTLVHLQAILERARISSHNQSLHIEQSGTRAIVDRVFATFDATEHLIEEAMHQQVMQHPAWEWLTGIKGIGPQTACLLLGYLLPPLPGKGPSTWYKAAGLYAIPTEDGTTRLPRFKAGEKPTWHPRLRRNLYVVGTCLLRAKGFYYERYLQMKEAMEIKHPDYKGRNHAIAFWKMVKLFLAHLYQRWAEEEHIPITEPYPMAILGHVKIAPPESG